MIDICLCGIARDDCDYHKPEPVVAQVPVYDVSGTVFIAGVTNFTAENVFDSILCLKSQHHLKLQVDINIFDRLNSHNLLCLNVNNKPSFQNLPIYASWLVSPGPVFSTFVMRATTIETILITREW
jgi:hypothetical protein